MRKFFALLTAILSFGSYLPTVYASANSAQPYWDGITASGEIFKGENCPLEVKKEVLIFNIDQLPSVSMDLSEYTASVTAEYTFYNPANYTVRSKLLFPFGAAPYYGYNQENIPDYEILVDGEVAQQKVRYTYIENIYSFEFDADEELKKYHEEYLPDGFFYPDMPVYKYTYTLSGEKTFQDVVAFDVTWKGEISDREKVKTYSDYKNQSSYRQNSWYEENEICFQISTNQEEEITFYILGEDVEISTIETNFSQKNPHLGTLSVHLEEKTETNFLNLVNAYNQKEFIPEQDFYNAFIHFLQTNYVEWEDYATLPHFNRIIDALHESECEWMRWYEYEMEVPPMSAIVNSVTAPMYPTINNHDGYMRKLSYDYTYLLSPAKTWSKFESLEIIINTPYELASSSIEGFRETAHWYRVILTKLPDGELTFRLLDPDYHSYKPRNNACFGSISIGLPLTSVAFGALWYKKKKKN